MRGEGLDPSSRISDTHTHITPHSTRADHPRQTFRQLYDYSLTQRTEFWSHFFHLSSYIHSGDYARVVDESATIDQVPRWFEGVRLNFAENVLYSRRAADPKGRRSKLHKEDGKVAITEVREGGSALRECSWAELRAGAARLAAAMYHARGVRQGDRVVVVAANSIETFVVWVATSWLGAIFSSSSTDMGVKGILQRTVQVDPKVGSALPGCSQKGVRADDPCAPSACLR